MTTQACGEEEFILRNRIVFSYRRTVTTNASDERVNYDGVRGAGVSYQAGWTSQVTNIARQLHTFEKTV